MYIYIYIYVYIYTYVHIYTVTPTYDLFVSTVDCRIYTNVCSLLFTWRLRFLWGLGVFGPCFFDFLVVLNFLITSAFDFVCGFAPPFAPFAPFAAAETMQGGIVRTVRVASHDCGSCVNTSCCFRKSSWPNQGQVDTV